MKSKSKYKWNSEGRKQIKHNLIKIKELASSLFYYSNEISAEIIDFILLPAISIKWKMQNPLWCQLISAPGSGKTLHVSLLETWRNSIYISRLSKNSLISGYREANNKEYDPSFLNLLNNKLLIIKDFTCILQSPKEDRDCIIGQLRDIYDGKAARVFGNIGLREYKSRFNLLLAVTHIIDGFHTINVQLGERFISRREVIKNRNQIIQTAFKNTVIGFDQDKFDSLKNKVNLFLNLIPKVSLRQIHWPNEMSTRAIQGANFISLARSHVIRDSGGYGITSRPSPEVGTRLVTQIAQMVSGYCILNGLTSINERAWAFGGARVLCDTLPISISWILYNIYLLTKKSFYHKLKPFFVSKDILPMTKLGWRIVDQTLTDLYHNGVLEAIFSGRMGIRKTRFRLKQKYYELIGNLKLFEHFSDELFDVRDLPYILSKKERQRNEL